MCIRCGEHPTRSDDDLCPVCVISIKVEVARGMQQLSVYLRSWAAFSEWCAVRGAR